MIWAESHATKSTGGMHGLLLSGGHCLGLTEHGIIRGGMAEEHGDVVGLAGRRVNRVSVGPAGIGGGLGAGGADVA